MRHDTARWRRSGAATAVALVLAGASACSSGTSSHPSLAVAVSDPAGQAALVKAASATTALRSYAFRATQKITGGAAPQVTVVAGRAVRPVSLAYSVTVGSKVEQVVKIGPTVYVRIAPAAWNRLVRPTATVDPLASLQALLAAARFPQLHGSAVMAQVPAAALSAAQLAPTGATAGSSAPVTFTLDAAGRVASVALTLTAKAGSTTLTVVEKTEFTSFGAVPAVTKP